MIKETLNLSNINAEHERKIQEAKGNLTPKALFTINDVFNTLVYATKIERVYQNVHVVK